MTVLNYASDGNYPELIALFRATAALAPISAADLIEACCAGQVKDDTRLRGALSRWTDFGLFSRSDADVVSLAEQIDRRRSESVDSLTSRLPELCRKMVLATEKAAPLWGESAGISADFSRGCAWLLCQDIYRFPSAWTEVEPIEIEQVQDGVEIIRNDVRWNGLRFWMRYLGFATGDSTNFQIDPTGAVRAALQAVLGKTGELPARQFRSQLSQELPVLDGGEYRQDVETMLRDGAWPRPPVGQLSTSLSFALKRLQLGRVLEFDNRADAGSGLVLSGRQMRPWGRFTHVRLLRAEA